MRASSGGAAGQLLFLPGPFSPSIPSRIDVSALPPPGPRLRAWLPSPSSSNGAGRGSLPLRGFLRPRRLRRGPGSPEAPVAAAAAGAVQLPPERRGGCPRRSAVRTRSGSCPCSRLLVWSGALHAGLLCWRVPGPRARLENLRRSLAPARRARGGLLALGPCWSRSGPLGKFPSARRSGQGQVRARGAGPREGAGPEPRAAGSRSVGAQRPAPESKRNS